MEIKDLIDRALQTRTRYEAYEHKMYGKTWTRMDLVMGMVVDLGDFIRLAQAVEGKRSIGNAHEKMKHELAIQAEWTEHWHGMAQDLFQEWIWDACGSLENANIHWDDMYFNCKEE